ncbi:MAG: hypothetical protein GXY61_06285 [Lentisphaerae bacterium]|nr:hypothetical protein [Lentisphaerota bacterium]
MKLIATRALVYGGKRLRPGDEFNAARQFGRVIVAIGKAKLAPPEPRAVAEPAEASVVEAPEVIEEEPKPKPKPKRTYKRRDITAENESEG